MARDYAQLLHRIWSDPEFTRGLDADAQRLYMLLLSQPSMNYAGVLDLTVGRWARYAPDTSPADVRASLRLLEGRRFVLVDQDTEEALVRTFVRNDGLYRNVRMLRVAVRESLGVQSAVLRRALAEELAKLPPVAVPDESVRDGKPAAEARAAQQELAEAVALLSAAPADTVIAAPAAAPTSAPAAAGEPAPEVAPAEQVPAAPDAAPGPGGSPGGTRARAIAREGDGAGVGDGVGAGALGERPTQVDLEGVTGADAREREQLGEQPPAVPDTRPAPHDQQPDDEADARAYEAHLAGARQRIGLEPPEHPEAMPADRCPPHRELAVVPPCGRCARWREAQQRWIAERDAKVRKAREEAQAEMAEQRRLERQAIADCGRCDDRGMTPHGTRCGHTPADEQEGPGRAAVRAEMEKLRQRAVEKARTEPATGEQLAKLAIQLGERGLDRDARLAYLSEQTGRPIGTSRALTKAEAGSLIEALDGEDQAVTASFEQGDVEPADDYVVEAESVEDEPDPRWADPGWKRVPLNDGGTNDPGTFVPVNEPPADEPEDGVPDDGSPDLRDAPYAGLAASWTDEDTTSYAYAGGPDDPPF